MITLHLNHLFHSTALPAHKALKPHPLIEVGDHPLCGCGVFVHQRLLALGKSLSLSRLYSLICVTGLRAIELAAPTSFLTP